MKPIRSIVTGAAILFALSGAAVAQPADQLLKETAPSNCVTSETFGYDAGSSYTAVSFPPNAPTLFDRIIAAADCKVDESCHRKLNAALLAFERGEANKLHAATAMQAGDSNAAKVFSKRGVIFTLQAEQELDALLGHDQMFKNKEASKQ